MLNNTDCRCLLLGLNRRSHIMHPKYNPFSFHLYLGKYSDSVIHPGIACGELNLNKDRLREKAYLNFNSLNHRECPCYFISKYTGDASSIRGFPGGSAVKNQPTMQETQEMRVPGSGRSPGGGHSNPLQYSCLENPMDRGAWWATVHGVAKRHD